MALPWVFLFPAPTHCSAVGFLGGAALVILP